MILSHVLFGGLDRLCQPLRLLLAFVTMFACRQAHRLAYRMQRMTPLDRSHARQRRLYAAVGSEYDSLEQPPPCRPKRVGWCNLTGPRACEAGRPSVPKLLSPLHAREAWEIPSPPLSRRPKLFTEAASPLSDTQNRKAVADFLRLDETSHGWHQHHGRPPKGNILRANGNHCDG
jgi:hypothetical protein